MSEAYLSEFEKTFLLFGVQDGLRLDGRNCNDYRPISVAYDYVTNSYGSCQLRLGDTNVVATVKAEIGSPNPATPTHGTISFFVDCSAIATPDFQNRGGDYLSSQLVSILNCLYSPDNFDLTQLAIIPGKKCWNMYVDIVVLEFNGNLCDACVLAVKFSLSKSELPKLVVRSDDEGQQEIEVVDDPYAIIKLNTDNVPYAVSVCKIGHNFLIDADLKEESVTKVKLIYGFDTDGYLKFTSKEGFGSLDPETLYSMTDMASRASKELNSTFNNLLNTLTPMDND